MGNLIKIVSLLLILNFCLLRAHNPEYGFNDIQTKGQEKINSLEFIRSRKKIDHPMNQETNVTRTIKDAKNSNNSKAEKLLGKINPILNRKDTNEDLKEPLADLNNPSKVPNIPLESSNNPLEELNNPPKDSTDSPVDPNDPSVDTSTTTESSSEPSAPESSSESSPPTVSSSESSPPTVSSSEPSPPTQSSSESTPPTDSSSEPSTPIESTSPPTESSSESSQPTESSSEPSPTAESSSESSSTESSSEPSIPTESSSDPTDTTLDGTNSTDPTDPTENSSEPTDPTESSSKPTQSPTGSPTQPTSAPTPPTPSPELPANTILNNVGKVCIAASLNIKITVKYTKQDNSTKFASFNVPTATNNYTGSCYEEDYEINYFWDWDEIKSKSDFEDPNAATVQWKKKNGKSFIKSLKFKIRPNDPRWFEDAIDIPISVGIYGLDLMEAPDGYSSSCEKGESAGTNQISSIEVSGKFELDGGKDDGFSDSKICPADEDPDDDSPVIGFAIGIVAALLVIVVAACSIRYVRKQRRRKGRLL